MTASPHAIDPHVPEAGPFPVLLGQELELSLPDLGSAGYRWDYKPCPGILSVTRKPSPGEAVDDDVEAIPGNFPDVVLSVRPLAAGEHALALELRRPWEDAPSRRVLVRLNAHRPTLFD